jgi:hypothetical protein
MSWISNLRYWVWYEPTEGILPRRVGAFERREDADAYVTGHPDTHVEDIEATAAPARVGPRAQHHVGQHPGWSVCPACPADAHR